MAWSGNGLNWPMEGREIGEETSGMWSGMVTQWSDMKLVSNGLKWSGNGRETSWLRSEMIRKRSEIRAKMVQSHRVQMFDSILYLFRLKCAFIQIVKKGVRKWS